jgi:plasmid stabilization system protein ParE
MAAKLIMAQEAEDDVNEAYGWYERRRTGLGEEFLDCVDACIQPIRRTPTMHALFFQNFRRGFVRRFPYVVFYEYEDKTVTVHCVFHTSQNPDKWRERLSG